VPKYLSAAAILGTGLCVSVVSGDIVTFNIGDGIRISEPFNKFRWEEDGYVARGGSLQLPDDEFWPDNGSRFWRIALGDVPFSLSLIAGGTFDVVAIDLAEYSLNVNPQRDVDLVAVYPNGETFTWVYSLDALADGSGPDPDFETVFLPFEFCGITEFRVATGIVSLDNVVVVPAPWALPAIGLALIAVPPRRRSAF